MMNLSFSPKLLVDFYFMELIKKGIVGYEGLYEVHSNGLIWSCRNNKYLSYHENIDKYRFVSLTNKKYISKTFAAHRLVAQVFISNPENKRAVNHKNGIKWDNRVENLEWNSYSENIKHAFDTGLKIPVRGEKHPSFGKFGKDSRKAMKVNKIDLKTGEIIFTYGSGRDAAKDHNVVHSAISNCCSGWSKSCKGFKFEYVTTKN